MDESRKKNAMLDWLAKHREGASLKEAWEAGFALAERDVVERMVHGGRDADYYRRGYEERARGRQVVLTDLQLNSLAVLALTCDRIMCELAKEDRLLLETRSREGNRRVMENPLLRSYYDNVMMVLKLEQSYGLADKVMDEKSRKGGGLFALMQRVAGE